MALACFSRHRQEIFHLAISEYHQRTRLYTHVLFIEGNRDQWLPSETNDTSLP